MNSSSSSDSQRFQSYQETRKKEWEDACLRCGACCGAFDDDPCSHLRKAPDGKYYCDIYENRIGKQRTQNGRSFRCVPIRTILHKSWPGDWRCIYKKKSRLGS